VGDRRGSAFAVERHNRLRVCRRTPSARPATSDQRRKNRPAQVQPRPRRPPPSDYGPPHVGTETTAEPSNWSHRTHYWPASREAPTLSRLRAPSQRRPKPQPCQLCDAERAASVHAR
jgi:hypothetical protein